MSAGGIVGAGLRPLRVMLAEPPAGEQSYAHFHPNLGLLYLAGAIRERFPSSDVEVSYLPGFGDLRQHVAAAAEFQPDLYGITFTTPLARLACRTVTAVKLSVPGCRVVAGGPHCSALPEDVLRCIPVDVCFRGECEESFGDLVEGWSGRPCFERIPGVSYWLDGAMIHNPAQPLATPIDKIPWPAWDLVPLGKYSGMPLCRRYPAQGVTVSRGCPYHCSFCSDPVARVMGRPRFRARTPQSIVDEVQCLYGRGVREFRLWCSEINADLEWAGRLMRELARADLPGAVYTCNVRGDAVTPELADLMKEARVWLVSIGVESASARTLDGLRKGISHEQLESACARFSARGIRVLGYFLLYPAWEDNGKLCWETSEDARRTIRYAARLWRRGLLNHMYLSVATPRPASELWNVAHKHALFTCDPGLPFYYASDGLRLPGIGRFEVQRNLMRGKLVQAAMSITNGGINRQLLPYLTRRWSALTVDLIRTAGRSLVGGEDR